MGIATEPVILGDLLARLLERTGVDDVVDLRNGVVPDNLDFDAVVTTIALPDGVQAGVVLELPATDDNSGTARLRVDGNDTIVDIDGLAAILRLLDEQVPGHHPRLPTPTEL